jgi:ATP-binding cassette subfamily F protein 3
VMLVSHDRALLRAVCDEFWMVSRGGVEPFDGDLDDYQRYLLDEGKRLRAEAVAAANAVAPQPVAPKPAAPSVAEINEKKRPLKKELDSVEKNMAALELEKTALHDKLATPLPPADIAEAGKRIKVVEDELAALEVRWLELTEAMEVLQTALA